MRITLAKARERLGLTPEDVADRAKLHRATVYRIEAGEIRDPSNSTVQALETALGLKRGSLVFGVEAKAS